MSFFLKLTQDRIEELLKLHGATVKVYLAILHHADINNGECWPGYRRIGAMTGLTSGKQIREHIDVLIDKNMIERTKERNKYSYRVLSW